MARPGGGLIDRLVSRRAGPVSYLAAIGYVIASMGVSEVIYQLLDTTRLSMIFMAGVLLSAVTLGAGPAMLASALAFLCYNFYLVEPRFTLSFEVEDFEVLGSFLVVALMTGGLAGRLRDETRRSVERARTLEALFEASRRLSATESEADLRRELAGLIGEAIGAAAWVFAPGVADDGAEASAAAGERVAHLAAEAERRRPQVVAEGELRARSLAADGQPLGTAVWRNPDTSSDSYRDRLAGVLLDLGAAAISRARLGAEKAQVEAVARTERLRTALLSSISHDFRTPLAAILASSSTLLEFDDRLAPESRRDLATTVQEEGERLNRFVANLLNMTRLESGALELQCAPAPALEIAMRAAERVRRSKEGRRIAPRAVDPELLVTADPLLLEHVLTNLMENAASFSPAGSEVELNVRRAGDTAEIEVADHGPGVTPAERTRIFDKFYRTAEARQAAQGTGLGLSIAKGLVEAMGGRISARDRPDGQSGLSVVVTLPSSR